MKCANKTIYYMCDWIVSYKLDVRSRINNGNLFHFYCFFVKFAFVNVFVLKCNYPVIDFLLFSTGILFTFVKFWRLLSFNFRVSRLERLKVVIFCCCINYVYKLYSRLLYISWGDCNVNLSHFYAERKHYLFRTFEFFRLGYLVGIYLLSKCLT